MWKALSKTKKMILGVVGVAASWFLSLWAGGVVLTAVLLVSATYIGSLITLSRIPDTTKGCGIITRVLLAPIVTIRNFLLNNTLVLTLILATGVSLMVGLNTVTGVVALAVSAVMGDMLVMTFKEILDYASPKVAVQS